MTGSDPLIPDVAIVIAAWNAEKTLGRTIESALQQREVTIQVLVVDDASTDGTLECAREFAERDSRVEVLSQSQNQGPAAARNLALNRMTARYATPLDSDDYMEPNRIELLLKTALDGGWDFVADDLWKVAEDDPTASRQRLWSDETIGTVNLNFETFIEGNLSSKHGGRGELGFLKPLISKTFLDQHGLRYNTQMRLGEDYLLYASALLKGAKFCLTDPAGYIAVVRSDSLSGQHSARELGALVQADQELMKDAGLTAQGHAILQEHSIEVQKKWHWLRLIDAVKARDLKSAIGCFVAHPKVVMSLLANLGEQVVLRSSSAVKSLFAGQRARNGGKSK